MLSITNGSLKQGAIIVKKQRDVLKAFSHNPLDIRAIG